MYYEINWSSSNSQVSQVALVVKNPPANAGDIRDGVWSLGWEDPLEEGMATYSSILAWRMPWTEEPGGLESIGLQRVRHDWSNLACTYVNHCFFIVSKSHSSRMLIASAWVLMRECFHSNDLSLLFTLIFHSPCCMLSGTCGPFGVWSLSSPWRPSGFLASFNVTFW